MVNHIIWLEHRILLTEIVPNLGHVEDFFRGWGNSPSCLSVTWEEPIRGQITGTWGSKCTPNQIKTVLSITYILDKTETGEAPSTYFVSPDFCIAAKKARLASLPGYREFPLEHCRTSSAARHATVMGIPGRQWAGSSGGRGLPPHQGVVGGEWTGRTCKSAENTTHWGQPLAASLEYYKFTQAEQFRCLEFP